MIVFVEITPKWPLPATVIRACSAADRRAQTWNGQKWAAAIHDPGELTMSVFDGDIGSEISSVSSAIVLDARSVIESFPGAQSVRWEGASVKMWAGEFTTPPGSATYPYPNTVTQILAGNVTRFEKSGGAIKLTLDPAGVAGSTKVLSLEYAGTGGAEGGTDLKGNLKPWLFGIAKNVEPVLIDEDNSVYQFSGYGPIKAVDALYERGASFGSPTGNYATYAALIGATIPAGRWATCLAEGLVRLGAPQFGVITGDVQGDYFGDVLRRRPGEILQRIATYRGIDSAAIDTASLNALDAFASTLPAGGYMNLFLDEQTSFLDLARRLCAPYNAQAGFTMLGKLIACRIAVGAPSFTIDTQGRRLPLVASFVEADTPPPFKRIVMSAETSWRVHNLSTEIAFYATPRPAGQYSPTETYREGDIVTVEDGSTWLYINPTATSGNPPPAWPTLSNSYWQNMTAPAGRGKLYVQSGAPDPATSIPGDIWQDADGLYWERRSDTAVTIGAVAVSIGSEPLEIAWAPTAIQPVRTEIDEALATAVLATEAAAQLARDAQATADGKVQSFFVPTAPTAEAVGDLWFDTDDGNKPYRWSGTSWVLAQDTGIGSAIAAAAGAQATADGKVTTFVGESAPTPEGIGDLWFKPSTGVLQRWSGSAWQDIATIGATPAQISSIAQALTDAANAQATADGKIDSFYQASPPAGASLGDLWFDTDDGFKLYRWGGSAWVAVQDTGIGAAITAAAGAQATADGKVRTFVGESTPTASGIGDLWYKASTKTLSRWSGSAWVAVSATGVEDSADVTSQITGQADIIINADHTGVVTTSLPKVQPFVLMRNGVDVTASATWSVSVLSGTISASFPTPGSLSLNASGGALTTSTLRLTATYGSTTRKLDVRVTKKLADPPPTGNNSSTSGISASIPSTTPVALSGDLNIFVASSGNVQLSAYYTFTTGLSGGSQSMTTEWYEWNGSSFVAVSSSQVAATSAYVPVTGEPGEGSNSKSLSSLTPSAAKTYRLYGFNSGGTTGAARSVSGIATATSS